MKKLDLYLQKQRINKIKPWISSNSQVLDIGCFDGELFRQIDLKLQFGVGIDPLLDRTIRTKKYCLIPGRFPEDLPREMGFFDSITALAVFEHLRPENQSSFAYACKEHLKPGGRVLITVPSNLVDRILDVLVIMRLVDGMALEEHHNFNPADTISIFLQAGFIVEYTHKFQLGLNNLFVFQRT